MFGRTATLLLFACLGKAESPADKSWKNLGHTIKQSNYIVAMRDGRCFSGHIESFDDNWVIVDSAKLERKDIVRVGDGTSISEHDVIYSARSSWSDLNLSDPNQYEQIELELKNNKMRECRKFSAAEDASCDGSEIERSEVARGYYIRLAPATEWEHHVARENVTFLAPRTWFDYTFFPRIKVLLYDVALPQENVKISCKVP